MHKSCGVSSQLIVVTRNEVMDDLYYARTPSAWFINAD